MFPSVPYPWIRFLHIASVIVFFAVHGASMVVLYMVRKETSRTRVESLLRFSAKTVVPMYIALAMVAGTGFWLGLVATAWMEQGWFWLSVGILVVVTALMWLVARPFGKRILAACEMRPSGIPRVSDEEFGEILNSQKTNVITAIGVVGFGLILYLMVFKPAF